MPRREPASTSVLTLELDAAVLRIVDVLGATEQAFRRIFRAREAEQRRHSYEAALAALQQRQSADSLRERFVALVHDTLAAGCAATRYDSAGAGADPIACGIRSATRR